MRKVILARRRDDKCYFFSNKIRKKLWKRSCRSILLEEVVLILVIFTSMNFLIGNIMIIK